MDIAITKGRGRDYLVFARADGSQAATDFPHKGPVPHDAVHCLVESALGLADGFCGWVAGGTAPQALAEMARAAGHASAARAGLPEPRIVGLLQAERLVECFEAELWAGLAGSPPCDEAVFAEVARVACAASHVPLPPLAPGAVGAARRALNGFAGGWIAAPVGHKAVLEWRLPQAAQGD